MKERGLAVIGWAVVGALGLGLCPLLWSWLAHQPTSSCYGLVDGVSTSRLLAMPLWLLAMQPSLWPCSAPAILMPLAGLLLVLRRPRGWGWLTVGGGWCCYAVSAVSLAGVGC